MIKDRKRWIKFFLIPLIAIVLFACEDRVRPKPVFNVGESVKYKVSQISGFVLNRVCSKFNTECSYRLKIRARTVDNKEVWFETGRVLERDLEKYVRKTRND